MFEHRKLKSTLGGLFAMISIVSGLFFIQTDRVLAEANFLPQEVIINLPASVKAAEVLPELTGVSQEFYFGHPGVDITAPLGSKIFPIKEGVVVEIGSTRWNYGRSVTLDHGDGVHTLYAHMGKIFVEEGEKVGTSQPLGEVGMTGRTTGPHLHLEIMKKESRVNPRPYLALNRRK